MNIFRPSVTDTEKCPHKSSGYSCDRTKSHGHIHYDAMYDVWWIFEPQTDDERNGRALPTGYVILTDEILRR